MTRENDLNSDGWEFDPSERPVPLIVPNNGPEQGSFAIADEAESIVRSARDELTREDTDPTGWATEWSPRSRSRGRRRTEDSVPRLGQAALLIGGCVAMFSLGWAQGIPAGELPQPSVERKAPDAGRADVKSNTEGQRPTGSTRKPPIKKKGTAKEVHR